MTILFGTGGSPLAGSCNSVALHHAQPVAPKVKTLQIASIAEILLCDGDTKRAGGPPLGVAELKERIVDADCILLVIPEYDNSIPDVLNNTIHRLSRPASDIPGDFGGRSIAITGATPRGRGAAISFTARLPVAPMLDKRPRFGRARYASRMAAAFNRDGQLTDEALREKIERPMEERVEFISDTA